LSSLEANDLRSDIEVLLSCSLKSPQGMSTIIKTAKAMSAPMIRAKGDFLPILSNMYPANKVKKKMPRRAAKEYRPVRTARVSLPSYE